MKQSDRALLIATATCVRDHMMNWINSKNPDRRAMIADCDKITALLDIVSRDFVENPIKGQGPVTEINIPAVKPILPSSR